MHVVAVRTRKFGCVLWLLNDPVLVIEVVGSVEEGRLLFWVRTVKIKRFRLLVAYRVGFRGNERAVASVVTVVERLWIVGFCTVCELVP